MGNFEEGLGITGKNVDDYVRIMFFTTILRDSEQETVWIPGTYCKDMYPNDLEEIGEALWICPDADYIHLHNNPITYRDGWGSSLSLVVQTCTEA